MIFNCSMIEPGHPCVTITRAHSDASNERDEVNVHPAMFVVNCAGFFSLASTLRQS